MGDHGLNKKIYLYKDSFSAIKLRNGKAAHQIAPCESLLKGFQHFGWKPKTVHFSQARNDPPGIGVMFNFWSKNKPGLSKEMIYKWHMKNNIPLICMDAGAFNSFMSLTKGKHKQVGWKFHRFGLNSPLGTGNYFNHNSDSKQYEHYIENVPHFEMRDWQKGKHVLVLAQNPIGFQFEDELTYNQWIIKTIDTILNYTDREVHVRMHPNSKMSFDKGDRKIVKINPNTRVKISPLQGRLNFFQNLEDVHCCVTHSSSSAVDTIMHGVPTFVMSDRCLTTAGHVKVWEDNLEDIENITYYDREQWAHNLAYTSYTNEQLASRIVAEKFLKGLNML